MSRTENVSSSSSTLVAEVRGLIVAARERVAQTVNTGLTLLYWQVGDRIHRESDRIQPAIVAQTVPPLANRLNA